MDFFLVQGESGFKSDILKGRGGGVGVWVRGQSND